jgi:hypothetical protein
MMWKLPAAWTWTPLGPHLLERTDAIGSLAPEGAARVAEVRALEARQAALRRRLDDLYQSLLHRAFRGEL